MIFRTSSTGPTDNLPDCQHSRFHCFHPKNSIASLMYYTRFLNPRIMISIQTCQLVSMFTEMEIYIFGANGCIKKNVHEYVAKARSFSYAIAHRNRFAQYLHKFIHVFNIFSIIKKKMKRTHSFRESNDMTICDFIYIYIHTKCLYFKYMIM